MNNDPLLDILKESNKYNMYINDLKSDKKEILLSGLSSFGKRQIMYGTHVELNKNIIYIVSSMKQAENVYKDFKYFGDNVYVLPEKEILDFNVLTENKETLFKRMDVLKKINISHEKNSQKGIFIIPIEAMMQSITPKKLMENKGVILRKDDDVNLKDLSGRLEKFGYTKLDIADVMFTYSIRGGIIDIADGEEEGIRIELWGDTIISLRRYNLDTQRSISKENENELIIYPVTEYLLENSLENITNDIKENINVTEISKKIVNEDIENILNGNYYEYIEKYFNYFYKKPEYLIDYLESEDIIVFDDKLRINHMLNGIIKNYNLQNEKTLLIKGKVPISAYDNLLTYKEIIEKIEINRNPTIYLNEKKETFIDRHSLRAKMNEYSFSYKESNFFRSEVDTLFKEFKEESTNKRIILLAGENKKSILEYLNIRFNKLKENINNVNKINIDDELKIIELTDNTNTPLKNGVYIKNGTITEGFEIEDLKFKVIDLSDLENKNEERKRVRRHLESSFQKADKIVFADLESGDYIVHKSNGVGKFIAIEKIESMGITKDYIKLEYKDQDYLYIPTDDLSNVRKYIGNDAKEIKLNKLGSKDWEKAKSRVKKSLREIAEELVKLYALRSKIKGYAYSKDTEWQKEFEDEFKYVETDDQLRCIDEIKKDMESSKPMDRLLCGDVGFGKTEVAMRAAFKAINDSKQVAYIVPTTVLAFQQYKTFKKRMANFPVEIEHISRFKTKKEQEKIVENLKSGKIDIIIGTHRLLSKDITFRNLGMLIVDEEHRFGVKAKEAIKQMKNEIDVLSMSATPIPRTMHMSLSGTRDMSVIYDPPQNRKPINTYIIEEDPEIIKAAIIKELERNGQVYYIHNTVEDIERTTMFLSELVPEARFDFAHGKMSASVIEDKMEKFVNHEIDVLVCTSILESGIDVPNANTIIIENSDKLGLAQLYQMRGRVGRSKIQAYAYITFKKNKILNEVAEKRLKALREFTELGSGFKIAMRDLEIRGAGSLFGEVQHGHLDQVGYDTYTKLLNEAIKEVKGEKISKEYDITIDLGVDAFIPDKYVKQQKYKMDIYQEIVTVKDNERMKEVISEISDRYGEMPVETKNFIKTIILRNIALRKGIIKILEVKNNNMNVKGGIERKIYIDFSEEFDMDNVAKLITKFGTKIKFRNSKLEGAIGQFTYNIGMNGDVIKEVYSLLKFLNDKKEEIDIEKKN